MKRNHIIFNFLAMVLIVFLIANCSENREESLLERTKNFSISECRQDCGVDSIGVKKNKVLNGDLFVRLGYMANCSWGDGYLKDIKASNDTLYLLLDKIPEIDTVSIDTIAPDTIQILTTETYPLTSCDCFFFFDFSIKNYE